MPGLSQVHVEFIDNLLVVKAARCLARIAGLSMSDTTNASQMNGKRSDKTLGSRFANRAFVRSG